MSQTATFWVLAGCLLGLGCSGGSDGAVDGGAGGQMGASDADTGATTCPVTAPISCPTPVHFAEVQPIFNRRCVTCHNGVTIDPNVDAAIWALVDYEHISDWKDSIRGDLSACSMPPADAGSTLTVEERLAILQWVKCGALP